MSKEGWHSFQIDTVRGVGDRWDDLKARGSREELVK